MYMVCKSISMYTSNDIYRYKSIPIIYIDFYTDIYIDLFYVYIYIYIYIDLRKQFITDLCKKKNKMFILIYNICVQMIFHYKTIAFICFKFGYIFSCNINCQSFLTSKKTYSI